MHLQDIHSPSQGGNLALEIIWSPPKLKGDWVAKQMLRLDGLDVQC